jgi:TonB family protein
VNENENNITKVEDIVKPIKELSALTPDPVAREKAEEMTIKTQDQLDKINVQVSHDGDSVKYVADNGNNNIVNNDHIDKNDIKITHNDNPDKNYNSYEVEVAPECVNLSAVKSSIDYPKTAIEAGIEGRVSIKVLVSSDGHVIQTGSITGPDIFYDEVRDKAKNLEFTPGLQNGKSVKVWVTVPFNFRLKNN